MIYCFLKMFRITSKFSNVIHIRRIALSEVRSIFERKRRKTCLDNANFLEIDEQKRDVTFMVTEFEVED